MATATTNVTGTTWTAAADSGEKTDWSLSHATGRPIGVDRARQMIQGFVVAQEGAFKTEDRGEFDKKALRAIVKLMRTEPIGLKSHFRHPDLSHDGLGKLLGRAKNPFLDTLKLQRNGETVEVEAVRADLHFSQTAFNTPGAVDFASYVMDLAEEDPDALSSSLVLKIEEEVRLEKDGTRKRDEDGNALPPLWRPLALHAADIVDTGDAVDGLLSASLSADGLPDEVVRKASALFKQQFAGKSRLFVEPRLLSWVARVLDHYYGDDEIPGPGPDDTPTAGSVSMGGITTAATWQVGTSQSTLLSDKVAAVGKVIPISPEAISADRVLAEMGVAEMEAAD